MMQGIIVAAAALKGLFTTHDLNRSTVHELQLAIFGRVNGPIHVLRTKRPSFAAVSVTNQYQVNRNADAFGLLTHRVTGSICLGQFRSVHVP